MSSHGAYLLESFFDVLLDSLDVGNLEGLSFGRGCHRHVGTLSLERP